MDAYLCAIGDIVGDHNMVFAGKNNGIIKIYLSSEFEVNKLFETHPQIVICNKAFILKRLVDNGHRIFLCNVEPEIPDELLIDELSKHTKVVSPLQFVNLGCRNGRFSHLIGYRRMVSVEDVENIPPHFTVSIEDKNYKIFTLIDKVKCFRCNAEGHLSKSCPVVQVSAQERLETAKNNTIVVDNSDVTVKEFVSPTASTASTSIEALTPSFSQSSASQSTCEEFPQLSLKVPEVVTTNSQDNSSHIEVEEKGESQVVIDTSEKMDILEIPPEVRNKKRASNRSPDNTGSVKKVCTTQNTELAPVTPLVVKYNATMDPVEFIRLIEGLKNSRKKLDLITNTFDKTPSEVISLLEDLSADMSLDLKLRNKLKNLAKSIKACLLNQKSDNVPSDTRRSSSSSLSETRDESNDRADPTKVE
ncbi:hypothetical protein M8J77_015961 [Diaphorina citri]|nr:hypothetical protein M8J77_015961 [Diaphorina citri]